MSSTCEVDATLEHTHITHPTTVSVLTGGTFDDLVERLDLVEDAWDAIAKTKMYGGAKFVRDIPKDFFPVPSEKSADEQDDDNDSDDDEDPLFVCGTEMPREDEERLEANEKIPAIGRSASKVEQMMAVPTMRGAGGIQINP